MSKSDSVREFLGWATDEDGVISGGLRGILIMFIYPFTQSFGYLIAY